MSRIIPLGLALFVPMACELEIPDLGEPFVSEQLMGRWTGEWGVGSLRQEGTGVMDCWESDEEGIVFNLWLDGGFMATGSEPPHEIRLSGPDDKNVLVLKGVSDKIGNVELRVSADGSIVGEAIPDGVPAVEIGGYVTPDTVYLGFQLLEVIEGEAVLRYQGPVPVAQTETRWDGTL